MAANVHNKLLMAVDGLVLCGGLFRFYFLRIGQSIDLAIPFHFSGLSRNDCDLQRWPKKQNRRTKYFFGFPKGILIANKMDSWLSK